MKNTLLSTLTIAILSSITSIALADYQVKIPLEANGGGSLPNHSISIKDPSTSPGNGNGSTEPTEPLDPTEPVEPTEPNEPTEPKPRSLVFSGDFNTFSGETNLWTNGKNDALMVTAYTLVLKGALEHGKTYYLGNNGNECPFVADVCTTNELKRCGPFTSQNLSGQNTILSKFSLAERNCIDVKVNQFTNTKSVKGIKVYDGPSSQ